MELRRPGALHLRLWQGGEACGHSQAELQLPQAGAGGEDHACVGGAWASVGFYWWLLVDGYVKRRRETSLKSCVT
jgi:hypothetical protein